MPAYLLAILFLNPLSTLAQEEANPSICELEALGWVPGVLPPETPGLDSADGGNIWQRAKEAGNRGEERAKAEAERLDRLVGSDSRWQKIKIEDARYGPHRLLRGDRIVGVSLGAFGELTRFFGVFESFPSISKAAPNGNHVNELIYKPTPDGEEQRVDFLRSGNGTGILELYVKTLYVYRTQNPQ